jgi:hypothetical protein
VKQCARPLYLEEGQNQGHVSAFFQVFIYTFYSENIMPKFVILNDYISIVKFLSLFSYNSIVADKFSDGFFYANIWLLVAA